MDHNTPVDPITAEIGELQKPLKGRRPLSWFLFTAILGLALIVPVLAILFAPAAPSAPSAPSTPSGRPLRREELEALKEDHQSKVYKDE